MKNIQRVFLFAAFFFVLQTAKAQDSNVESLVQKFFASLKAKDEKAFVALYPNATQFSNLMRTMMQQVLGSEQMQQMMAMDPKTKDMNIDSLINAEVGKMSNPEAFAEMQKSFAENFQKTIVKGEKKGVNWSDATYTGVAIDSNTHMPGQMEALKDAGFKAVQGVIDFRSAGTDYQMSFDKIIFIPSEGWYGGEFPQIAKKGESLQPDPEPDEPMVDSVAVPQKKATKSKTKSKTPTSKTKTKIKTSARKPATKS